jgi:hypothetical protein
MLRKIDRWLDLVIEKSTKMQYCRRYEIWFYNSISVYVVIDLAIKAFG